MFSVEDIRSKVGQNQSGQATIEAVLMAVIGFLLVSGLVYQFHTGFRDYVDNYFGNYLVCLLETGELPSLGVGRQDTCSAAMAAFEMGEAGPELGEGQGSGGTGSSESQPARSADRAGGAGGSSSGPALVRAGGGRYRAGSGDEDGGASAQAGADKKPDGKGGGDSGEESFSRSSGYRIVEVQNPSAETGAEFAIRRYRSVPTSAQGAQESSTRNLIAKENENALRATKLTFDPKSLQREPDSESDGSFLAFSDFLRYLIILAILIAIIVLVGGQALQISKSRDL